MVIDKFTNDIENYKICAANGEQMFGIQSFDTETQEAEMMMLADAKVIEVILPDGTRKFETRGSGITIQRIKLEGAYATYRGVRV